MKIPTLFALCAASLPTLAADTSHSRQSLDFNWRFSQGDPTEATPLGAGATIPKWRFKTATADDLAGLSADANGANFADATPGQNVFNGSGFAWFRATLADKAEVNGPRVLRFDGVDDNATVYLNGQKIGSHQGWSEAFDLDVSRAWKANQPNELAVLVENTAGVGGIAGAGVQIGIVPPSPFLRADFDDSKWRTLNVPHDFVVENDFDAKGDAGRGSRKTGIGWYRKTFSLPASAKGKSVWLDFDGVYRDARVYLNGQLLGNWKDGYTPFRFDISKTAKFGSSNSLVVRADARANEGWWYEGGGIYRHVWLTVANPQHVAPWGVRVQTKMAEPKNGVAALAKLNVRTELRNDASTASVAEVESRVFDPNGKIAALWRQRVSLAPNATQIIARDTTISKPKLWSIEAPRLYRIETRVFQNSHETDFQADSFGVRTIRFDAQRGFFLNGRHVEIKGTCNHQDFAGVGIALPDSLFDWRVKKLKEMGSNAYRTSHNPVAQELLDACDRQGMLVMDETRHLGDATGAKTSGGTKADDLSELKMMVKRDRNHPSVVIWSMANEEGLQSSAEGARIFKAMKQVTDGLDGTRPVSAAMNGGHTPEGFHSVQDIEGFNYDIGSYDSFHARFPQTPMYGSETASAVATRGEYVNDPIKGYVSNYDQRGGSWANTTQDAWRAIATRPFVAGGFVWTGFDYRGEPTPYGWPCINSHFGIMDMCGFPKDAYYYYGAWWGGKPLVHLFPDWNATGKTPGQIVKVVAYGNTPTVELLLNGRSLGAKAMPPFEHVEWDVPFAPGVLEARGLDANGDVVSSHRVETTGKAVALRLSADRTQLKANGQDATVVEVSVVDSSGRVVPDADPQITFSVRGAGQNLGVGNGDPSSHESDKSDTRRAFHGRAMLVVGAKQLPSALGITNGKANWVSSGGAIQVGASAVGLKGATVELSAK